MIYFFTKGDRNTPSSRMRVHEISDRLIMDSKVFVLSAFSIREISFRRLKELFRNIFLLLRVKSDDILYLHKSVFQWDFIFLLFFFRVFKKIRFIVDFDDPIFLYFPRKTKILVKKANAVIVGSHFLLEYSLKHNKNSFLIPTSVDHELYSEKFNKRFDQSCINIGWIGTLNNLVNFEIIKDVLVNLDFDFNLLIIGDRDSEKKLSNIIGKDKIKIKYIHDVNWTKEEDIVNNILKIDIGIMPLFDTLGNKGKCAFKAIQYMACGIPAVCSAVGENNFLIEHEKNGFLAKNKKEWKKYLTILVQDKKVYRNISTESLKTIKNKYSYKNNIKEIKKIINNL